MLAHEISRSLLPCSCPRGGCSSLPPATAGAKTRRGGRAGSAFARRPPMQRAIPGSGRRWPGLPHSDRRPGSAHGGLGARAHTHLRLAGQRRGLERRSADCLSPGSLRNILATPSGGDFGEWMTNKARGTLVDVAAVSATVAITRSLKTAVGRTRPNGQDDESFPSGHTSSSAVHTRLASRNLRSIEVSAGARRTLDIGLYA